MLPLPCGPPRAQGSWTLGLFTMFVCIVKPQSWIETTATTVLYTRCVEDFVAGFCRNPLGGVFDRDIFAHLATVLRRGGCSSP